VLPATLSVVVVKGMREGEVPLAGKRAPRIVTGGGVGGGEEVKREPDGRPHRFKEEGCSAGLDCRA